MDNKITDIKVNYIQYPHKTEWINIRENIDRIKKKGSETYKKKTFK